MNRTKHGNKWECQIRIQGASILLGPYEYRSDAIKADEVAGKIREGLIRHQKAVDRTKAIERFRFKEAESAIKDSGVVR